MKDCVLTHSCTSFQFGIQPMHQASHKHLLKGYTNGKHWLQLNSKTYLRWLWKLILSIADNLGNMRMKNSQCCGHQPKPWRIGISVVAVSELQKKCWVFLSVFLSHHLINIHFRLLSQSWHSGQSHTKSNYMGHCFTDKCLELASEYALCPNLPHQQILI